MVVCGEQQPESDHFVEMENSVIGSEQGTPWRETRGWFAYKTENQKLLMKVNFQHSFWFCFCTYSLQHEISGVDALRGHTRSHPEHDG